MMELTKKPPRIEYHDYLKEMRGSRVETAKSKSKYEWKKILNHNDYSNREKYNSVMDHVTMIESEAKQK